ncbi:hypothetical protein NUU61_007187 [Penicillium alfredii]|uniref:GST N-terminal domain-containing protein n=1 Tax=Penicillium alfredii TaxID=1506179 RepID=A0A9W9F2J5_9EURO|nr:uncharacterized protein NUU61_007187 [Penicillium alfredii]KAJ5092317.1 hypothetical protein NUU61_007187 [Penicillium alfredii]
MAGETPVHFFDLYSDQPGAQLYLSMEDIAKESLTSPTGPLKSWSPNTLKTRVVLNFKGIPYTQSWHSYPDIKPLISSFGVPPNDQGRPYTLPAIKHSSVTFHSSGVTMDSQVIALHLDKVYPSPPLFPSGDASYALFVAVSRFLTLLEPGFRPFVVPRVPDHLDPRGSKYFHETRAVALGKPLSQVRPTDQATIESKWELVESETVPLLKMLKGRDCKKGPFFEGEHAGYADLLLATALAFIQRFDTELHEKFLNLGDGEFRDLYQAVLPWLEGQGEEKDWPVPEASNNPRFDAE